MKTKPGLLFPLLLCFRVHRTIPYVTPSSVTSLAVKGVKLINKLIASDWNDDKVMVNRKMLLGNLVEAIWMVK